MMNPAYELDLDEFESVTDEDFELKDRATQLRRAGRYDDAIHLLLQRIADRPVPGQKVGCPYGQFHLEAAMNYRKMKDYEAEIAIVSQWLSLARPEMTFRKEMEARLRRAWHLAKKEGEPPIPVGVPGPDGFWSNFERFQHRQRQEREDEAREFLSTPVLADDDEEAHRRLIFGLPNFLIDKPAWIDHVVSLAGNTASADLVARAMAENADRWGVLEVDQGTVGTNFELVREENGFPYWVDRRTGEVVRVGGCHADLDMWLAAETQLPLAEVQLVTQAISFSELAHYSMPGHIMHGKYELREFWDV